MSSVPERPEPDERELIARRPDLAPAVERLDVALARLLAHYWLAHRADELRADELAAETEPAAPKQRKARPKPSRLAKWEASWQAEQGAEAQS